MPVKFFDAPISDDELNLRESLDAPTLTFKRQRVVTAPMPFRPEVTEQPRAPVYVQPVAMQANPSPRAPRRTRQWVLAALIVIGLGAAGHFGGAHARNAITHAPPPIATPVIAEAKPELVATPVVRITAPAVPAKPTAKPTEHRAHRADPTAALTATTATTTSTTTSTSTSTPTSTSTSTPTSTSTSTPPSTLTPAPTAPAPTAEDDLMRQATETLSNAQLEGP